ncbi:MAG: hypothetical protein KC613_11350, partial [Myxococcales bacterium]|nr:hypothetical protein [Myxococcales bacterium]
MRLADLCPVALPAHDALPLSVHLGAGLRHQIPELAAEHLGERPLVLVDPHTSAAVGPLRLGSHWRKVLPPHPHADVETVAVVQRSLAPCTGGLAIGSGTVNDLMKRASTLEG